jgi:hypothetical protein
VRDDHPNLKSKIVSEHHHGGKQVVYEFKNGYGASVIKTPYSYGGKNGKWELALLRDGELYYNGDYPDVVGHLNDPEVDRELQKISRY